MTSVHVLNGPNLNLLGTREPDIYGRASLADVQERCAEATEAVGLGLDFRQTNHEGELVEWLHEAGREVAAGGSVGAVLNAGGLAHTSIAVRDAVVGAGVPVVEVHLTNVHAREDFRQHSFVSPVARGVIAGFGPAGYEMGIRALAGE